MLKRRIKSTFFVIILAVLATVSLAAQSTNTEAAETAAERAARQAAEQRDIQNSQNEEPQQSEAQQNAETRRRAAEARRQAAARRAAAEASADEADEQNEESSISNEAALEDNTNAGATNAAAAGEGGEGGEDSAESDEAKTHSLLDLFEQGGSFMWPILLLAALGIGVAVERLIFFIRANLGSREFIEELENTILKKDLKAVEKLCDEHENKIANITKKGLKLKQLGYERVEKDFAVAGSVQVTLLERGLNIISAVGNLAPMLGFLGTVVGMIVAFNDIAAADQVSAKIVAGGIKQALITTASGLLVAIPILLIYNYFTNKIEAFIADVERLSSDIVEKLIQEQAKGLSRKKAAGRS